MNKCVLFIADLIQKNIDGPTIQAGECAYYIQVMDSKDNSKLLGGIYVDTFKNKTSTHKEKIDDFKHKGLVFKSGGCMSVPEDTLLGLIEGKISPKDSFEIGDFKIDSRSQLENMFYLVRLFAE
jgi:hypothetical protein